MKDKNMWFRLSDEEKEEIKIKAALMNLTPSAYVRMILKNTRADLKIQMKGGVTSKEKKYLTKWK